MHLSTEIHRKSLDIKLTLAPCSVNVTSAIADRDLARGSGPKPRARVCGDACYERVFRNLLISNEPPLYYAPGQIYPLGSFAGIVAFFFALQGQLNVIVYYPVSQNLCTLHVVNPHLFCIVYPIGYYKSSVELAILVSSGHKVARFTPDPR